MKIAIITDQHFGARKSSRVFHDFFNKFYTNVFFPTLKKRGIDTVLDLGDTYDNRRTLDPVSYTHLTLPTTVIV